MDKELKDLLEAQSKAFNDFKTANDERLKSLEKKSAVDPLLTEAIDKANKDISRLSEELKNAVSSARRPAIETKGFDGQPLTEIEVKAKQAFINMVRKGVEPAEGTVEHKAMVSSDDPNGGYLIPRDLSGRIVRKIFESSSMRTIASVQTISTDALEGTFDDDELAVGMVGEQAARVETTTPKLGVWRIPVHEGYCKPRATQRLLDDSATDVEAWLAGKISDKLGRFQEAQYVAGDGNGKARGIITYTPVLTGSGSRSAGGTVRTVKTGTNGNLTNVDRVVSTIMALKAGYRKNGQWLLSREGIEKVRLLVQDGKYIWAPSVLGTDSQNKLGDGSGTLLGYAITETNDLPLFATGSISGVFGDIKEAYQIVDRQGIRVLRDPYSSKPFVEFYTTARWGGDVVNFESLIYLQASA